MGKKLLKIKPIINLKNIIINKDILDDYL